MTTKPRRIPTIPNYLAWDLQAPQYDIPEVGDRSPGLHEWRVPGEWVRGIAIDVLLHYDADWLLDGILTHYPDGSPMDDQPGDITVLVRPDRQRRGIGRLLVEEAVRRWQIDLDTQCLTDDGNQLVRAIQR